MPNDLPENPFNLKVDNCEPDGYPNCGYDLTGKALSYIFGELGENFNPEYSNNYNDVGQYYVFDQKPYTTKESNMNDYGFMYVPDNCK